MFAAVSEIFKANVLSPNIHAQWCSGKFGAGGTLGGGPLSLPSPLLLSTLLPSPTIPFPLFFSRPSLSPPFP